MEQVGGGRAVDMQTYKIRLGRLVATAASPSMERGSRPLTPM
jgi:hypothetical protein